MKIKVFYHAYLINDYEVMIQEQIDKLISVGLYEACSKLYIGLDGPLDKQHIIISKYVDFSKIEFLNVEGVGELGTLDKLYTEAAEDSYILYLHTKSITYSNLSNTDAFISRDKLRVFLEYYCLELWKKNVNNLDEGYDTSGANYCLEPYPHYSGNFWWATSRHINKLSRLDVNAERWQAERWIGTTQHKAFNFYTFPRNPAVYEELMYVIKKID